MSVNLLDIVLVIPLIFFGYNGFRKGLIIEVTSLAAFILGLFFAFYFSDFTAGILKQYFTIQEKYMAAISFIVTFIAVLVIVLAVGKILEKFIDILMLGFVDKLAGGVFGILKGALFLSIIIFVLNYFDANHSIIKQKAKDNSVLYQPIESIAPALYSWLHFKNFKFHLPDKDAVVKTVTNSVDSI
ncbi:MAG: CvpA family protein [Bacteroidales bacterium]|nr:CvpA family protein [Bacteroidales bacterium]